MCLVIFWCNLAVSLNDLSLDCLYPILCNTVLCITVFPRGNCLCLSLPYTGIRFLAYNDFKLNSNKHKNRTCLLKVAMWQNTQSLVKWKEFWYDGTLWTYFAWIVCLFWVLLGTAYDDIWTDKICCPPEEEKESQPSGTRRLSKYKNYFGIPNNFFLIVICFLNYFFLSEWWPPNIFNKTFLYANRCTLPTTLTGIKVRGLYPTFLLHELKSLPLFKELCTGFVCFLHSNAVP